MASTGLCSYICYNDGTDKAFGIVTGGSGNLSAAPNHLTGVGGTDKLTGALIKPSLSLDFNPCGDADFITSYVRRDTGSTYPCTLPTPVMVKLGLSSQEIDWYGLYCNSLNLQAGVDQDLTASVELVGLTVATASFSNPSVSVDAPYTWYGAEVTLAVAGGTLATCDAISFGVTVENNLEQYTTLNAKDTGTKRYPVGVTPGHEALKLELTTLTPLDSSDYGLVATDDVIESVAFQCTCSNGTYTMTLEMSNLAISSADQPIEVDGVLQYSYSLEAPLSTAALLTITVA